MKAKIQEYPKVISPNGLPSAVLIPIKEWNHMQMELQGLRKKLNEIQGIQSALEQVRTSRSSKKKLQTLKSFLNER
ncbi:MAG: hypothetical protein KBF93_23380 [Leptospiraceae bacterium]|nr:hypothetical protein [Leptospiraceae bacterium]